MKKWISLLLAVVLLLTCMPLNVLAANDEENVLSLEQPTVKLSNAAQGITIKWNAVAGAEFYQVSRKAPGGSWTVLTEITDTSYLDKSAAGGVTYAYRVVAKNGKVTSARDQFAKILRLAKPEVTVSRAQNGVSIAWTAVAGAQTYRVYRKVPGGSWAALKTGLTDQSYIDTTAQSGAAYLYAVRSYNTTGGSAYASSSQILWLEQPEVTLSNKAGGIRLSWNEVDGADRYRIYRKDDDGSWNLLITRGETAYQDSSVKSGTTYSYRIVAKRGAVLSGTEYSAHILRLDPPKATASNGNQGVLVKWNEVKGAESYQIFRQVPGGSWKKIASDVTTPKYTDTAAKSGSTYSYAVRAYGDGILSSFDASDAVTYLSRPVAKAETASPTGVKLQWNAVEGAKEYIVYIKTADTDWKILNTGVDTEYTAEGLTMGNTYSFEIRAVSGEARSTKSAAVSAKATFLAPDYSLELKAGQGILISWTAVEGAGSYRVYRREIGGSWTILKTTTSTSYVDTEGKPGVTYEYAVRPFELAKAGGVYGHWASGKTIVYSKIDPSKPMVALTFDDGPSAYTKDILDQLEKYNAHATFFVVGNRVSSYASTIERADSLGCEIGNHSWSHPQLSAISVQAMRDELDKTDDAIKKIIGHKAALLRPPYGAVDADVKAYAGKPLIHWSIDTLDWSTRNSSSTISSVLNNVRDGSIVLMHDIYSATRDAAVSLIPTLISRGYQLVTVSELAAYRDVELENGTIYYSIR